MSLSFRRGYLRSFKLKLKSDLELERGNMRRRKKECLCIRDQTKEGKGKKLENKRSEEHL